MKESEGAGIDLHLQITDMAGVSPEHSMVIVNFAAAVRNDSFSESQDNI